MNGNLNNTPNNENLNIKNNNEIVINVDDTDIIGGNRLNNKEIQELKDNLKFEKNELNKTSNNDFIKCLFIKCLEQFIVNKEGYTKKVINECEKEIEYFEPKTRSLKQKILKILNKVGLNKAGIKDEENYEYLKDFIVSDDKYSIIKENIRESLIILIKLMAFIKMIIKYMETKNYDVKYFELSKECLKKFESINNIIELIKKSSKELYSKYLEIYIFLIRDAKIEESSFEFEVYEYGNKKKQKKEINIKTNYELENLKKILEEKFENIEIEFQNKTNNFKCGLAETSEDLNNLLHKIRLFHKNKNIRFYSENELENGLKADKINVRNQYIDDEDMLMFGGEEESENIFVDKTNEYYDEYIKPFDKKIPYFEKIEWKKNEISEIKKLDLSEIEKIAKEVENDVNEIIELKIKEEEIIREYLIEDSEGNIERLCSLTFEGKEDSKKRYKEDGILSTKNKVVSVIVDIDTLMIVLNQLNLMVKKIYEFYENFNNTNLKNLYLNNTKSKMELENILQKINSEFMQKDIELIAEIKDIIKSYKSGICFILKKLKEELEKAQIKFLVNKIYEIFEDFDDKYLVKDKGLIYFIHKTKLDDILTKIYYLNGGEDIKLIKDIKDVIKRKQNGKKDICIYLKDLKDPNLGELIEEIKNIVQNAKKEKYSPSENLEKPLNNKKNVETEIKTPENEIFKILEPSRKKLNEILINILSRLSNIGRKKILEKKENNLNIEKKSLNTINILSKHIVEGECYIDYNLYEIYDEFIKNFSFTDEATKFLNKNLFSVPKINFKYVEKVPKTDLNIEKNFIMLNKSYEMYCEKVNKARERITNQVTEIYDILESKGITMNSDEVTKEKFLNSMIWDDFTDEKTVKKITVMLKNAIKKLNAGNFQNIESYKKFYELLRNIMHWHIQKFLDIETKIKSLKSIILENLKKYRNKDLIIGKKLINSNLESYIDEITNTVIKKHRKRSQ